MLWRLPRVAWSLTWAGVQGAIEYPEMEAFIRKLMLERGLPVPPEDRTILSVCLVALCQGQ